MNKPQPTLTVAHRAILSQLSRYPIGIALSEFHLAGRLILSDLKRAGLVTIDNELKCVTLAGKQS